MKKFFLRAILGMLLIFCINQYFTYKGLSMCVGLNEISFLTSGILGFPGVFLLYGITILKNL